MGTMRQKQNASPISHALSDHTGHLEKRIHQLKHKYTGIWYETDINLPTFFKSYTPKEQKNIENHFTSLLDTIIDYLKNKSENKTGTDPVYQTRKYMDAIFQLMDIHIPGNIQQGVIETSKNFLDRISDFDSAMPPENIYQAMRNIWIMNFFQIHFGHDLHCSDSMFAYSMLYPYTDNLMDSNSISTGLKLEVNGKFKKRLEGIPYPNPEGIAVKLDKLVEMVEHQYPRREFPKVHQSMLGIYNAQIKSLLQQRQNLPPYASDILGLSFEKGGASVLADGYLVNGDLGANEEDFCFGLGTFLQLADDIQDIVNDMKDGHMTIFSHNTAHYPYFPLDSLANKLFHYITGIVNTHLSGPHLLPLKWLMLKSFYLHITEAVGKNREYYSVEYINTLERHFPVRFSYLRQLRKRLTKILARLRDKKITPDITSTFLMALTSRVYE